MKSKPQLLGRFFAWYIEGKSIVGLIKLLEENQIPSPRGKAKWSKRALETMLSNEKYIGNVHCLRTMSMKIVV